VRHRGGDVVDAAKVRSDRWDVADDQKRRNYETASRPADPGTLRAARVAAPPVP